MQFSPSRYLSIQELSPSAFVNLIGLFLFPLLPLAISLIHTILILHQFPPQIRLDRVMNVKNKMDTACGRCFCLRKIMMLTLGVDKQITICLTSECFCYVVSRYRFQCSLIPFGNDQKIEMILYDFLRNNIVFMIVMLGNIAL